MTDSARTREAPAPDGELFRSNAVQARCYGDTPVPSHPYDHIHFQQPDTEFANQFSAEDRAMCMDAAYPDGAHIGYLAPSRRDGRHATQLAYVLLAFNCAYFAEHLLNSEELTTSSEKTYLSHNERTGEDDEFDLNFLPFKSLLDRCAARLAVHRARHASLRRLPASAVVLALLAQNLGGDADMDTPRSSLAELGEFAGWVDAQFPL